MNANTQQHDENPADGRSASNGGLERMFCVVKTDHPDLVGGIVWSDCELTWINERIKMVIFAEREACAEICDELKSMDYCVDVREAASAIRKRSN